MRVATRLAGLIGAASLAIYPSLAAAQQRPCITEEEVSAMAIYSVPSLVQAVRTRCNGQLAASGFLAREGDAFAGRYANLQNVVWPKAKSGLLKFGAGRQVDGRDASEMFAGLPDSAVRPLIDALIVQEASAKIAAKDCGKIERLMDAVSPIDPEVTGTLLGVILGLAGLDTPAVCQRRV